MCLALWALLLLAAPASQAQFTYLTNNGAITITSYTGGGGPVVIPATITDLPVTDIGTNAFDGSDVTSVTIPDSVTNIGDFAFGGCGGLGSITIPNSVISLGADAFYTTGLTNVTFPANSLKSIGSGAFTFTSLTNVTIPASVTNLGQNVFTGSYSLKAINVAAGNKYYSTEGGVLFDSKKANLLEFPNGSGGNYVVPGSVTNIGYQAFWSCGNVTSVTIPKSVVTITSGAFAGCGMTNLTLVNGLDDIDYAAFNGCSGLTSVTIPSSVTYIGVQAFQSCSSLVGVFFECNAPNTDPSAFTSCALNATAYYLPKTTGWASTLGGIPTALAQAFFTVKLQALPAAGDIMVTGAGTYGQGFNATVTASSTNECYAFVNWTMGGKEFADNPYTFTVAGNETLTANYAQLEYTNITLSSPTNWGTTSGGGKIGCGEKVTLKATAKSGFRFQNWSGVYGSYFGTNNPYIFYASGNQTFVANFVDIQPPTLTITAPTKNEKIGTAAYAIEGTAKDNVGVANVYYSLNGANYLPASTTNGFTNWFANVTLTSESGDTIAAYAEDAAGNVSTVLGPIRFTCTAAGLAPMSIAGELALVSNGSGVFEASFGPAIYVLLNTNGNGKGEVGTYTYTPTGLNTAEFVPQLILPTQSGDTNGSVFELTFVDAYNAAYTNSSGGSGIFSFAPAQQSVPAALDGAVLNRQSFVAGGPYGSNVFGSFTNTEADSNGGSNSTTYTFTAFTPVAALVVSAFTGLAEDPGFTNYMILTFSEGASSSAGLYFSATEFSSGPIYTDFGSFSLTSNAVKTKFVGPVTVDGLQASVAPTGETSAYDYTSSFGNGTFASMYIPPNTNVSITNGPTEVGLHLANPRANSDTGVAAFIALAPSYMIGYGNETVEVDWQSSSTGFSTNLSDGKSSKLTFSKAPDVVPEALLGHTITAKQAGSSSTTTITFTFNTYSKSDEDSGTYTFAPYSPTMALVHLNSSSSTPEDVLLNFATKNYVSSKANNEQVLQIKYGTFTFK